MTPNDGNCQLSSSRQNTSSSGPQIEPRLAIAPLPQLFTLVNSTSPRIWNQGKADFCWWRTMHVPCNDSANRLRAFTLNR